MADPVLCRDENDEEPETWDDWVDDGEESNFACVFCAERVSNEDALHAHLSDAHAFSLKQQISARKLDTYATIQLVNYLRQMTLDEVSVGAVKQALDAEGDAVFKKEQFLKPVLVDDPLLYCLDCDDDFSDSDEGDEEQEQKSDERKAHAAAAPVEQGVKKAEDPAELVARLERENKELKMQMLKYSRLVHDFVVEDDAAIPVQQSADNDTYYFDSYSHVGIHREMITDRVRTDAYRNAILNNPELFKDKVVLDVGCGTGILSMFAAQAGAAKVIGIDMSEMGVVAQRIVNDNGFGDVITIIRGKVEEIELPVTHVDVIISEWMGYCLLYESMLDTVLYARDKWLVSGGHLFPDKCSMHIQGVQDSSDRVNFWDEVYGFNMQAIKSKISVRDAFIEDVPANDVITDRALLQNIDIDHVKYDDLDFRADFALSFAKDATFHGFVSSFDISFERDCPRPEYFTTGVEKTPTHWHQVFFHIETPFAVCQGETLQGKWWVRRNAENPRFLDVELQWKRDGASEFTKQSYRIH